MIKLFRPILFFIFLFSIVFSSNAQDSLIIRKIYDEALVNGHTYENLRYLCKEIGPRLSGSSGAQKSVEWGKTIMTEYGFDKVYLQECMVPHWVRGKKEIARIIDGKNRIDVPVCAIGMSPPTPEKGIQAKVIEVKSLEELTALGTKAVMGKIVFFNGSFDPRFISPGKAYSAAGAQRFKGPALAAKLGAVGVLVRSLTQSLDDFPHTGTTIFKEGEAKIPAAAISTNAANQLSDLLRQRKQPEIEFYFKQNCELLPDVKSYNVVGEITGTDKPNEFITVGGHLDSWDLAEGAHDDGAGVVQSLEVLRIYKSLNMKPKHSIRAVMFMNEENGARGGQKYADEAKEKNEVHIAAIEADGGAFTPRGFNFQDISKEGLIYINANWKKLLAPYLAGRLQAGGGGVDIEPLRKLNTAVLIGYRPDSQRYFDLHHSAKDVFEEVNKRELELGAGAMTSLVYLIDNYGIQRK